jgi:hypothetical protein
MRDPAPPGTAVATGTVLLLLLITPGTAHPPRESRAGRAEHTKRHPRLVRQQSGGSQQPLWLRSVA